MPYGWPFPHQDVYDSELRTFQSYGQCKVPDCPDKRGMSVLVSMLMLCFAAWSVAMVTTNELHCTCEVLFTHQTGSAGPMQQKRPVLVLVERVRVVRADGCVVRTAYLDRLGAARTNFNILLFF